MGWVGWFRREKASAKGDKNDHGGEGKRMEGKRNEGVNKRWLKKLQKDRGFKDEEGKRA